MSPLKKKIDGIELTRGDKTVVLQRTEKPKTPRDVGKWELVKPVKYAANERQIRQLFTRLERLEFWELLTQNKGDFDDLHVTDSKGVRVRLMEGDKVLADMVVGKTIRTEISGQNQTYTAVRKTGTDKVWKLVGSLTHLFDKPLNRWRDATILKETRDRIAAVVIRDSNGNFLAAQRDPDETDRKKKRTNWELVQSNPDIQELDTSDIGRLASSLSRLRTKEFCRRKEARRRWAGQAPPPHFRHLQKGQR